MAICLEVRPFESADADTVIALWNEALPSSQSWNEPCHVICRKQLRRDELFLVGALDGRVVATVIAGYDGVRGWIYAMAVASDCRRRGIGRAMLQKAENELRAAGCPKVNLQVRSSNSEVIQFYEQCGFAIEDRASLGKPLRTDYRSIVDPVHSIQVNDTIRLSQITWDDKPAYLKLLNESRVFHDNMGLMPFPYTDIDAEQWISKVVGETLAHDQCRSWAIRESQGALIGGIGAGGLTEHGKSEIGYWLARSHWGQGIATAAAKKVCEFVFDQYKVRKICARAFGTNSASARVLEKAGFALEGTLRSDYFRDGKSYDVLLFGLLRPL